MGWPQQPPIEKVLKFNMKSSVVIFWALETSAVSWTSAASATSLASTASTVYFLTKHPDPDGLIINHTKMTNSGHFFGMDHQKSKFSLIYGTLSVGGC